MTWGRRTTRGGYGAPQSEEEALTLGLIHTSLMRIEIRQQQKQKPKVGAPRLDHDMPVFETSFGGCHCCSFPLPTPLIFAKQIQAGQACTTRFFQIFLAIMII